jgi:hypothetical protein
MGINPPTAEQVEAAEASRPQKQMNVIEPNEDTRYQGGAYLDEVQLLRAEVATAKREDRKPNLKDHHPLTINAVDPSLLTKKQAKSIGVELSDAEKVNVGEAPLPNPNYPADKDPGTETITDVKSGGGGDWRENTSEGTFTIERDAGEANATSETDKNENSTGAEQDVKRDPEPPVKMVKPTDRPDAPEPKVFKIEQDQSDDSNPKALKATEVSEKELAKAEGKPVAKKASAKKKPSVKRPPASKKAAAKKSS